MEIKNLFLDYAHKNSFFWLIPETENAVITRNVLNLETNVITKIIQEVSIPTNFFKVVNFKIDPNGSQLIIFQLIFSNSSREVIIFQEDSQKILKLLTPVPAKLKRGLQSYQIETGFPDYVAHPSLNLNLVSLQTTANVYKALQLFSRLIVRSGQELIDFMLEFNGINSTIQVLLQDDRYLEQEKMHEATKSDTELYIPLSPEQLYGKRYSARDVQFAIANFS